MRIRITWPDDSFQVINNVEAQINAAGVIRLTRDVGTRYISPSAYKFADLESGEV